MTEPGGRPRSWRHAVFGIRTRLVGWYLGLFAVLLVVGLVAIRQLMLVDLGEDVDRALAQETEELRLFAATVDPESDRPFGADTATLYAEFLARNVPVEGEAMFAVVDGEVVTSSPQPMYTGLVSPALVATWAASTTPRYGETDTAAGEVRWLSVPVETPDGSSHFVVADLIGTDRTELDDMVRVMALASLGVLLVASVIGWFSTSQALAPIRQVTSTARGISETDLSERIPVEGTDEVAELSATFNAMLDRLEAGFATQRRFLDDISHDLRTPITIVRGHLELLPDDPTERAEVVAACLEELDAMTRLVADLLTLAKAERPDFLHVEPVDIAALTDGLEQRGRALAPDRRWRVEHLAPVEVQADPDRLGQAMMNLIGNAVAHTAAGDEIGIGSSVTATTLRLWVRDTGPGIAPEDQAGIFERFGRGDRSDRRREGTGLGLAIVGAIAEAHGGHVVLDSAVGAGSTFSILLPLPPDTDVDPAGEDWGDGTESDATTPLATPSHPTPTPHPADPHAGEPPTRTDDPEVATR